jgi:hypothetical protein
MAARRRNLFVKIAAALVVLAGLGLLFVRSARTARRAPYTLERQQLRHWSLAIDTASTPTAPLLVLRPPPALAPDVFHQIFARAMETLNAPEAAGMPLVLQNEFEAAFAGRVTPAALLETARTAGLERISLEPRCLALRRVSEPGLTRQVYFVLFDAPAFGRFREQLGTLARAGRTPGSFDPAALSPIVIVAGSGRALSQWLPIRADPDTDCLAPIVPR